MEVEMNKETDLFDSIENTSTGLIEGNLYNVPRGIILTKDSNGNQLPFLLKVREEDLITQSDYSKRVPSELTDRFGSDALAISLNRTMYNFHYDNWELEYVANRFYDLYGTFHVSNDHTSNRYNRMIITEALLPFPLTKKEIQFVTVSQIYTPSDSELEYAVPIIQSSPVSIEFGKPDENGAYHNLNIVSTFYHVPCDFTNTAYNELFYSMAKSFEYVIHIKGRMAKN